MREEMGIYTVKFPRSTHLSHHKFNDVSKWKHVDDEWVGVREKFIVTPPDSNSRYMVKFPKYGFGETCVELFNCCLGLNLNLNVASYFPCIDEEGRKGIITKDFLTSEADELWEMKGLICHYAKKPNLEEMFGRNPDVLKEHSIDNIFLILEEEFGKKILLKFFSMVGFDCLIGHGDRHWSNYGIIISEDGSCRFAPIYDTASGYLLEMTDARLKEMIANKKLDDEDWYRPRKRGLCKIICGDNLKTNHLELFEYILDSPEFRCYVPSLIAPVRRFDMKIARHLLKNSFYMENLGAERKFAIIKVLEMRKKILDSIIEQKLKRKSNDKKNL